jgi:hypothetical protein
MDWFPFGERPQADASADTFSSGQVPTPEHRSAAVANFPAVAPTSAMICCAPAGDLGQSLDCFGVGLQRAGQWLVQFLDLPFVQIQWIEKLRPHPPIARVQRGYRPGHITQLIWGGSQMGVGHPG